MTVTDLHRPERRRARPARTPTTRPGSRRCAASPEVLDCWFESGSMPFAQVHYPFENTRVVRAPLPRRLHRRVHRPRPAAGSTRCTCWPPRCSTGRRSRRASSHGIVLGDDGQKMSKSLQQLSRPDGDVRRLRRRRDALVPAVVVDPARQRRHVTEAGIRDTVRHVLLPLWNSWYFLALYANAADHRASVRTDSTERARPLHPGQDPRSGRRRHRRDGRLRPVRRLPARAQRSSTRSPTGTCAAAGPVLAGRP